MLQIGKKYYRCGLDVSSNTAEPVVETLVYQGYFEFDYTASSCDRPYHFYSFAHYGQEELTLNVPQIKTIERDYLSFPQLLEALTAMVEELRELNQQLPHSTDLERNND